MRTTAVMNMMGLGAVLALALFGLAAFSTPASAGGGLSGKCVDMGGIVAEWEQDLAEELADIEAGLAEVDEAEEMDELHGAMAEAMMEAVDARADHAMRVAKLQGDCMMK